MLSKTHREILLKPKSKYS